MNTINETYINSLLADAAYVTLSDVQKQVLPEGQINAAIAARLTQSQAGTGHGVRSCLLPLTYS